MNALAPMAVLPAPAPGSELDLLALCSMLGDMQKEWQRLWDATPDDHDPEAPTDADRAFDHYCDTIWPGYQADPATDMVAKLAGLPATTLTEFQAKAAALCAINDVGVYTGDCRSDECSLYAGLLKEVAGSRYLPLGKEYERRPT